MSHLALFGVLIAVVGLAFTGTGIKRLIQRRFINGIGLEFSGLFFLLLATSCFLLASNLYTYQHLVYEQTVAEVSFEQMAEQEYRAEIKALDSGLQQIVNLKGDEWQLDAQVLSWQGLATLFGLDANFRLHRISGRYLDSDVQQQRPDSVFSLLQKSAMIDDEKFDLWQFAHKYPSWVHWVDAATGNAMFLPMTNGAKYHVAISRTGLVARPANEVASQAVSRWIAL